jgi:hypothetical protein
MQKTGPTFFQRIKEGKPIEVMNRPQMQIHQELKYENQVRTSNWKDSCPLGSRISELFQQMAESRSIQLLGNGQTRIRRKAKQENQVCECEKISPFSEAVSGNCFNR